MITHRADQDTVTALRSAAPYIRLYKGGTFVVKAGDGVFARAGTTLALLEQLAVLCYFGVRVVLVHEGALLLARPTRRPGMPAGPPRGPRMPGMSTADVTSMVLNGVIRNRILTVCRELDVPAAGISAVDAGLLGTHTHTPAPPAPEPPGTGLADDAAADEGGLRRLLDQHVMPVLSPLAADAGGALHSIDADALAAAAAAALGAEKLILCGTAPGFLADRNDPRSLISYTDLAGLRRLREEGRLQEGMLRKADVIADALRGGVRRVHVVSRDMPEAILREVFSNEGTGTLVVADVTRPPRQKAAPARQVSADSTHLPAAAAAAVPADVQLLR